MSGDARVFPPISVPSLTLASAPGGTFNPNISTSFQANSAQTTAYNLIFPSALPSTTNQALLSDTSGNLTWGTVSSGGSGSSSGATSSAAYGTFAATAPQSAAAPVTGLQFTNTFTSAQLYVAVSATTNIFAIYDMQAYQKGSTSVWSLTYSLTTDSDDIDPGIVFSITTTGQVQYTSPTYSGWTATSIQWYYAYNYTTSTAITQITNSYSGASNVSTPTAVTGLVVPSGSKQLTVSMFVALKAATNLSALISLTAYLNAAGTGYQIQTTNSGDNVGIALSINASGQILYTSTTYTGFTSLVMSWTTPFIVSTTATSLTSLALSSGLTVNGRALLGQSAGAGSVVSTVGSLVSIAGSTYTDTSTAASSTATGNFSGTYLGIPTLAATNTAVINPLASTLTIAGAPLAGANTTLTSTYALNVLTGNSLINGLAYMSVSKTFSGRWFNNGTYTPPSGWNFLTGASISLAADIPPSVNATVSSTNVVTAVNYNSTTGLIFLSVAGIWSLSWLAFGVSGLSGSNGYELRLSTFFAPAWTAAGSTAKTYGSSQTASQLASIPNAILSTGVFVVGNESSISYTGTFPATTLIAPLIYSSNGAPSFPTSSMYFEAKLVQPMI